MKIRYSQDIAFMDSTCKCNLSTSLQMVSLIHIPAYYSFPLIAFVFISLIQGLKFYELNTASFFQTVNMYDVVVFEIILIIELISYSFIHQLLYYLLSYNNKKYLNYLKLPTFTHNLPFLFYYIFISVVSILDMSITNEMQMNVSVDYFKAYLLGVKQLFAQTIVETGINTGTGGMQVLVETIKHNVAHWTALFAVLCCFGVIIVIIFILSFRIFVQSISSSRDIHNLRFEQQLIKSSNDASNNNKIEQKSKYNKTTLNNTIVQFAEQKSPQIIHTPELIFSDVNIPQINKKFNIIYLIQDQIICNSFIVIQIAAVITFITLISCFIIQTNNNQIQQYVPPHWYLYKSSSQFKMSSDQYMENVNTFRQEYQSQISNQQYFLDQRVIPIYPLLRGSYQQYCSYNYDLCNKQIKSKQINLHKIQTKEEPNNINQTNVFMFVFESFSPSPKYLNYDLFNQQNRKNKIFDGSAYGDMLRNIKREAEKGITFLGINSNSLPTINGWHSLFTSEKPRQWGINMVSSVYNNEDSFIKQIRNDLNYYTSYFSPSPFDFDGKVNWVFGRGWFDEVHYYVPDIKQQQILNIYDVRQNAWVGDRISSTQVAWGITQQIVASGQCDIYKAVLHYSQYVNNTTEQFKVLIEQEINKYLETTTIKKNQPLFLTYMNVDTHTPFKGFDYQQTYNQFDDDNQDDYTTMIKATDHYFGKLFRYIQIISAHSIIALVGDHGAREQPTYKISNEKVNDLAYFDKSCQYKHFGYDNMFLTSAFIAGYNLEYKLPVNKTFNVHSDHDDFVVTLQQIIYQVENVQAPVTSRSGINLLHYYQQFLNDSQTQYDKLSVSATQRYVEFRTSDQVFRGNSYSHKNGILLNSSTYPTCIIINESKQLNTLLDTNSSIKNLYKQGSDRLHFQNYLTMNNQIFNYKFENINCKLDIQTNSGTICQIPAKPLTQNFQKSNQFFLVIVFLVIFGVGFVVGLLVSLSCMRFRRYILKKQVS